MTNRIETLAQLLCSCNRRGDPAIGTVVWTFGGQEVAHYNPIEQAVIVNRTTHDMLGMESYRLFGRTVRYLLENG